MNLTNFYNMIKDCINRGTNDVKVIRKWNAINSNSVFKFTFSTILLRHHRIILFYRYHRWDDFHIVLYMQSKAEAILKWLLIHIVVHITTHIEVHMNIIVQTTWTWRLKHCCTIANTFFIIFIPGAIILLINATGSSTLVLLSLDFEFFQSC